MNNKVFYQHPNLMRILGMHETVMEVMVNVLGGDKSQVPTAIIIFFSTGLKRHGVLMEMWSRWVVVVVVSSV